MAIFNPSCSSLDADLLSAASVYLSGTSEGRAFLRPNVSKAELKEKRAEMAKKLAEALDVPAAFLYTEDEMLAKLLLRWNDLSKTQKRDLVKQVEQSTATSK